MGVQTSPPPPPPAPPAPRPRPAPPARPALSRRPKDAAMHSRPAAALLLVLLLAGGLPAAARAGSLFTERVAPLLRLRCLSCHDGHKKRGGLDLSTRQTLLEGADN